jgi:hypothetical protein
MPFETFCRHSPLNRHAERYARQDMPLALSTRADQLGVDYAVQEPLLTRIGAHVFAPERCKVTKQRCRSSAHMRPRGKECNCNYDLLRAA